MDKKTKILISRMGNIGDMLFITPLLSAIKSLIPQSDVYVLLPKYSKEVLINNPDVDFLFTFYTKTKKFRNRLHNALILRRLKGMRFDYLLCLDTDKNVFSFLKKIPYVNLWIGFSSPAHIVKNWDEGIHAADNYLSLLEDVFPSIEIGRYRTRFTFSIPEDQKNKTKAFLLRYGLSEPILICPCTSQFRPSRLWPTRNWISLIDRLLKEGNNSIIIVSRTRKEKPVPELYRHFCKKIYFWNNRSLVETASLMSLAKAVVCLDSGTLHLSTAVSGGRVISLFGPSSPVHTGPYPNDVPQFRVIQRLPKCMGPCNTFPREKIPQECLNAEYTPCMEQIDVDSVWKAIYANTG